MPMHDWTRVTSGTYHDFHSAWITHLKESLNAGLLPPSYYALGEQRAGRTAPDVLTLRSEDEEWRDNEEVGGETGMIAVAEAPPRVRVAQEAVEDIEFYLQRRRTLVIRHASGDRVVALVEIVSPANKHTRHSLDDFIDKVVAALRDRVHVFIIDPLPPGTHDPHGIHRAVWDRLTAGDYQRPEGLPLTLVSYCAKTPITAYVEEFRVGSKLIDMPLFLMEDFYVAVPLETTYMQSWAGVPHRWRRVIESETAADE